MTKMNSPQQNGDEELIADRRSERRILYKGLVAIAVVAIVVLVRQWWLR
ncbi:hypothetical protein [Rudaeicoccus suwonensis]|uniref:Uncharacterized protein n=1 Tax=Rudaeicoccus suwonensis TaxID=657409 RepID=A0A561E8P2_9MICO|nr:hypothetical protein [Rudaeicoccus suwonensis]TWE11979.1 hypothetical protein BKA23_0775 [Rudaeicoccus suwonensis]